MLQTLSAENAIAKLKKAYSKREHINSCSVKIAYLTPIINLAGLMLLAIGNMLRDNITLWLSMGFFGLVSILGAYQVQNIFMLMTLLSEIKEILSGQFVDSSPLVKIDNVSDPKEEKL